MPRISLVIPAYNEEKYLGKTLESVHRAMDLYQKERGGDVEIIVVDNNSIDKTAEVAEHLGAKVVPFKEKNQMASARNAGAKFAQGDIITFVDADSLISENTFVHVDDVLSAGKVIGGGVILRSDNPRLDLKLTLGMLMLLCKCLKVGGGLFYLYRDTFETLGGFDETLWVLEDVDFAKRLREEGKEQRKKFKLLSDVYILTSMRKLEKINISNIHFVLLKFIVPMFWMIIFGQRGRFFKHLRDKDQWFGLFYGSENLR